MQPGEVQATRRPTGAPGPLAVLVLAGQRPEGDPMAQAAGIRLKALLPVGGRPMLERVIEALRLSPGIGQVTVSIPDPAALETRDVQAIRTEATPSLSVLAAIDRLPSPLLVTTADHALLTPEMVERFVTGARALGDADLVVGLVERATIEAVEHESRRTYWRFKDGAYSGANLFYLRNPRARAAVTFWRRVEADRKRPWKIVQAFGFGLLLGYLLGRLTLDQAMVQASSRLGCRVRALPLPFGEAAIDVDKPADLAVVERLLRLREAGAAP
jgi:GTP:adenosylcobinamide-phosphate guanylyltransferase